MSERESTTKSFFPFITDSKGAVIGHAGGSSAADHAWAEQWAREQREAEGPLMADEAEIRRLTGMPPYDDQDHTSPWVALRALGFPRPYPPRIIFDRATGTDSLGPLLWERAAVRPWLAYYDEIRATIQPPDKRHKHLR